MQLATGQAVVANDSYIRESILTPQAKLVAGYGPLMPTFQGQVSEESVMSIIEFIKSLPPAGPNAAAAGRGGAAAAPAPPAAAAQGAQR